MADRTLFARFAADLVIDALQDTPVVIVIGPRQCGKTTLVRDLVADHRDFYTFDDETVLAAAHADPTGLVRGLDRATIDEVQRAPDLLRAIKLSVDEDRRAGRFLLTGSANILALSKVSESLAGRMEIVDLLPLSRSEIRGRRPGFLQAAFEGKVAKPAEALIGADLVDAVLTGGYPEMVRRTDPKRRQRWARDYVRALVQRDVREIAEVEKLDQIPRLLQALAYHSGQLTNFTAIGGHRVSMTRRPGNISPFSNNCPGPSSGAVVSQSLKAVDQDAEAALHRFRTARCAYRFNYRTAGKRSLDIGKAA